VSRRNSGVDVTTAAAGCRSRDGPPSRVPSMPILALETVDPAHFSAFFCAPIAALALVFCLLSVDLFRFDSFYFDSFYFVLLICETICFVAQI
jgi:hypothetical protein